MSHTRFLLVVVCCLFVSPTLAVAADALSASAAMRVAKLLEEFDPNSYSLQFSYQDSQGKPSQARLGKAVGLASLKQTSLEREAALASAGTNTNINIFKPQAADTNTNINIFRATEAATNTNINIFKPQAAATNTNINIFRIARGEAGTNTNINIFVSDRQAAAANEIAMYLEAGPESAPQIMSEDEGDVLAPLDADETARIAKLLEEFDPNSYSLQLSVTNSEASATTVRLGKAVGLADLKQTSLERVALESSRAATNTNINIFKPSVAATNTNINIFRATEAATNTNINIFKPQAASTNTNINIFRVARSEAGTNTNINIFVSDRQAAAASELNKILQEAGRGE